MEEIKVRLIWWAIIKPETYALCEDIIGNFRNWKQNETTFSDGETAIFTNGGWLKIDLHPTLKAFNLIEKRLVFSAIKKARISKTLYNAN